MTTNTEAMRAAFEQWYAENAFDLPINPIGSRQCAFQWAAWRAALAQAEQRQEVLAGWKFVPVKLTQEMVIAARCGCQLGKSEWTVAEETWARMLAAAPQPKEPDLPAILQRQAP